MQNDNAQKESGFRKIVFPAENAEKTGFLAFSRDFISFFGFFAQRAYLRITNGLEYVD